MARASNSFMVEGLAPAFDPRWHSAAPAQKMAYMRTCRELVLVQYDGQLARGLGHAGEELARLAKSTIDHRRSAMGPADPYAPPLTPAHALSRTRSLVDARIMGLAIQVFWRTDEHTGRPWSRILAYHRRGSARLPIRNVFGLGPEGYATVRTAAHYWWQGYIEGLPVVIPTRPRAGPPARAAAAVQPHYKPKRPALYGEEPSTTTTISIGGHVYTMASGSSKEVMKAIAEGRFTGFRSYAGRIPGAGPEPPPPPPPPPKPKPSPPKPKPSPPKPPPPPPPPKPAGFAAELKARTTDLTDPKDIKEAVRRTINAMAFQGPEGAFHGMAESERFRTVQFLDIDWHFTEEAGPALFKTVYDLALKSIRGPGGIDLAEMRRRYPSRLTEATRAVYFTKQANKDDAYWKAKYADFDVSAATGGKGNVVIYGGRPASDRILAHEMGHNLAERTYGSNRPGGDYARAIATDEPPISDYARNSPPEDFAESARYYVEDRGKLEREAPLRYDVIDRLMKDASYGG